MSLPLRLAGRAAMCAALTGLTSGAIAQTTSVTFQNGLNGYNGTYDRRIADADQANQEFDGSTVADFFVDGYAPDGTDANTQPDSNDQQMLIRFDGMFGNGAGQIPAGATILDAKFTVTTSLRGNAQSSGPFGVAGLTGGFDNATSYYSSYSSSTDFVSRGPWWQDGSATRPMQGFGFTLPGATQSASVRSLVQNWADGAPAHGFAVQAGYADSLAETANTADGWAILSTGYPVADQRPSLSVTYTTNPIEQNVFQRDLNGYTSDSMTLVYSGNNTLVYDPIDGEGNPLERSEDASLLNQVFLDGPQFSLPDGTTSSPDIFGAFKFDNVFGTAAGQSPSDVPVAKAWLVLTTGDTSANSQSSGPWSAHRLLREVNDTTIYSDIGNVGGLQVADGDIGAALDSAQGMIRGSETWFDVTSYMEGVRNGNADYGVAVIANGTSDGWQIHANGSTTADARPRLVVYSGDLGIVEGGLSGDFNDDGIVNAADYTVYRDNLGTSFSLNGNGDNSGASAGVVDAADYALWSANYGKTAGFSATVPEPGSLLLVGLATGALAARRRS